MRDIAIHQNTRAETKLAELAARYELSNRLTESAPDYREPGSIVTEAMGLAEGDAIIAEQAVQAAGGDPILFTFLLAVAATKALAEGDPKGAEGFAQRALGTSPRDLHLQSLLARAQGAERPSLEGQFCRSPFENIETAPNGDVFFCCPSWLPKPIGNIHASGADEIWNSAAARDIRASIHDGSYRHCSRMHCPKLSGAGLEKTEGLKAAWLKTAATERQVRLKKAPAKVILAHDRSCNLACPSCRTKVILARKAEQAELNDLADRVLFPLLADADLVRVTASGDPFGSAHFQYLLRHLDRANNPRLRLDLQTNGLLLTPKLWDRLQLDGKTSRLMVSVDAARADTYAIVRRPGNFAVLRDNLDFFAQLRRTGRIRDFRLDFVVQSLNFREMPDFIALARELSADNVKFQMIRSWGTFTAEEFSGHNIGDRRNPLYPEFLEILRQVQADQPFAEFWGMGQALKEAQGSERAALGERPSGA